MATYFKDQGKRSENAELEQELASSDKNKKRDAVKKVIRDMTLGKDVSGLFSAVVNNMMTPNLEVRKLVYLYLINYAKTQPDLAIMAVNGFVKDARSHPQAPRIHPCRVSGTMHACPFFQSARHHAARACFQMSEAPAGPAAGASPRCASSTAGAVEFCSTSDKRGCLQRPESADPSSGCAHHGLHPRRVNQRVPLRVAPVRAPCLF